MAASVLQHHKSFSVVQFEISFCSILIPLGTAINTTWMNSSNFNLMFTISPLYTDKERVLEEGEVTREEEQEECNDKEGTVSNDDMEHSVSVVVPQH
jgi:hypothetical protein